MGKDTKIDFLSQILRMDGWMNGVLGHFYALSRLNWAGDNLGQILRKLWGMEYLAHLAQTTHYIFCIDGGKVAQGCWNGTFLIRVHMICQVNDVKYDM